MRPPARWFPTAAGLAAVNALVDFLAAHPDLLKSPAEALADLAELDEADRAGIPFQFAVVPWPVTHDTTRRTRLVLVSSAPLRPAWRSSS